MDSEHLSKAVKIVQAITVTAGAAAATDVEGTAIDVSGYESVLMVAQFGEIVAGAATHIKAQESADLAFTTPLDITGTKQVIADVDDNKVFYIDIIRPDKPYIRLHVDRATQNATVSAMYFLYGARVKPVAAHGTGVAGELFKDPVTGTA